jgi:pimeloyl-ACP methyl ester carboxylesterase
MAATVRVSRRTVLEGVAVALAMPGTLAASPTPKKPTATERLTVYAPEGAGQSVTIEALVLGKGPLVVMLPSLGRAGSDFDDLASRIAAAGYRTAAINPRGIGRSKGPDASSLVDYARDIFEVIKALQPKRGQKEIEPAVLIGHAFGNRLARAVATWHPEAVSSLILLAAGGQVEPDPVAGKALRDVFETTLSPEKHIAAVRTAFFAPGNDPEVWRDGWFGPVALKQQKAMMNTPAGSWNQGGVAPIYVVQAEHDALAPPANAEALQLAYPDRVEVAIVPQAGHAMLPEQPEMIARLVLARLRMLHKSRK